MEAMTMTNEIYRARARAIRRARIQARNEPPHLTAGEERFNTASHSAGALLAAAAMALLLLRSDTPLKITSSGTRKTRSLWSISQSRKSAKPTSTRI